MNKGLSLVELLIVVAILGIMAAIVLPEFQGHTQKAKESTAKENLRLLRNAIESYTFQHNGVPPGYPGGDPTGNPHQVVFAAQLTYATNQSGQFAEPGTDGFPLGPYLSEMPENPFNGLSQAGMIINSGSFPDIPTGNFGWLYKPATKEIRLDWPGTDSEGVIYYDY